MSPAPGTPSIIVDVIRLVQRSRLDLSSEKHLQEGVAEVLQAAGIAYEREKRLSSKDIPDFLIAGGVVVECKMRNKSKKMDIFRQLARYATYPEVTAIILASNVSMGLPPELEGKPLFACSLSHGWI